VGIFDQEAAQGIAVAAAHVTEMGDPGKVKGSRASSTNLVSMRE
jgi:hypothetical protein